MRPVLLGCAVFTLASASACSRNPPSSDVARGPAPPPAVMALPLAAADAGVTTTSAKLQLATAVEEALDAGAPAPPPLTGKTVLHVGDSMVGGNFGLTKALEGRFTG